MNQKPNDSQTDVKNEDIVIEENTGENKPDVVEGVTAEPNYDTPERKQGFFSTKKGKMVLFGIIGVVILAALIGILIVIFKKKPCVGECCDDPSKCPPQDPCVNDPLKCEPCVSDPSKCEYRFNKNDLYVYSETLSKESNIILNVEDNKRRLNDNSNLSQKTTINSKYLINVYDVQDFDDSNRIYYAYAAVIDMNKQTDNKKKEDMGGKDIREINKIDDTIPVAKFSFNEKGEILSYKINKNMNTSLASYLKDFIEKVIYKGIVSDDTIYNRPSKIDENDMKEEQYWDIKIEKKKVKKITGKKVFELNVNFESQLNGNSESNFTDDIETDQSVNRGSQIKQIKNDITLNYDLSNNTSNEILTNKIKELLNSVNFVDDEDDRRRLLPKEFYNLRNLETIDINTYAMPIHFSYPLFKSDLLGAKVGLIADVIFTPMEGKFYMEMIFDANGIPIKVFNETKKTNFKDIVYQIRRITQNIYLALFTNAQPIKDTFNNYEIEVKNILKNLYTTISTNIKLNNTAFTEELNSILKIVNETTANSYNESYEITKTTTKHYSDLLISIKNKNEEYSNSITLISKTAIEQFINVNKENLNTLFEAWKDFYTNILYQLKANKKYLGINDFYVDVGIYYNIKDAMNDTIKIYKDFLENIEYTLQVEKNKFKGEVNNKFEELIDPELSKIEFISENAEKNISVIDAMRGAYNDSTKADNIRSNMIKEINDLRNTTKVIMNEILSQISDIYQSNLNSDYFLEIANDIKTKYTTINNQQLEIIKELREYNKHDEKFDIYFDDIKILNELEIQLNNERKEYFKTYIGDYFYKKSDYFLTTSEITEIKTTIKKYFTNLGELLDKLEFTNAKAESKKLEGLVKSINEKYITKEISKRVINYYSDRTMLNQMFENYFNKLKSAYNRFNTTFFDINYINHRSVYASKPTELINKLLDITYSLNPDNSLLHRTVQDLIESKIKLGISSTSIQIYQIIFEEYNQLIQSIFTRDCCVNSYNSANVDIIKNNLKKFIDIYIDKDGKFIQTYTYTSSNKDDEFNLKSIIVLKTNEIIDNILRIVDQINIDFHDTFCYGIKLYCAFVNVVGQLEHYYYQASKLRVSISFVKSIVSIAKTMFTDKILIDLKPEDYSNLFKLELDYKETEILVDINTYLTELNKKTLVYISESLQTLKTHIISYFKTGVNIEGIKEKIQTYANLIFIHPTDLLNQINAYIYYACGPLSKIILAFNAEIEYFKRMSENSYHFDEGKYKNQFDIQYKNLQKEFEKEKEKLFKELKVPDILFSQLKKIIKDFIYEGYETISENINSLTNITKFEFLNMTFSVKDITKEALNEAVTTILNDIDETMKNVYNKNFETLLSSIKEDLDKQFDLILRGINYEYEGTVNYYKNNPKIFGGNNTLKSNIDIEFRNDTINQIKYASINLFIEKINEVYSESALENIFYEYQLKVLKENSFTFNFMDFLSEVKEAITQISYLSYQRLATEKTQFQSQIIYYYKEAFKRMIIEFIYGKGKDYLTYAINFDYENNIYHDFSLMKAAINQTYYTVKTLLNTPELRGLGYVLVYKFVEVFPEIESDIRKIIPNKVEDVIYPKIDLFIKASTDKITNLYTQSLEGENNKIITKLSSKVSELIPKNLNSPFKAAISEIFRNNINKTVQEIKELYNKSVKKGLDEVLYYLKEYGDQISQAVSLASITETDQRWYNSEIITSNYEDSYKIYNNKTEFKLNVQKIEYIDSFIKLNILPRIKEIYEKFYEQENEGQIKVQNALQSFTVGNIVKKMKLDFSTTTIENNIISISKQINSTFLELRDAIVNHFTNLTKFTQIVENINIEGFNEKRLRNLEDYDLRDIEDVLSQIEKDYKDFIQNLLDSDDYTNIATTKSGVTTSLSNTASTFTNDFYAYKVLIEQYVDGTKIEKYFKDLEEDATKIRNNTMDFIFNYSQIIDNSVKSIHTNRLESWPIIRAKINSNLFSVLDDIFKRKLEGLIKFEFNSDVLNKKISIPQLKVKDENGDTLNTIDISIKDLNINYGCSLEKLNDFDFTLNVYSAGNIDLTIVTNIDKRIIETISGKLGSGTIGVNANYTLHDKSLDYTGYVNIDEVNYNVYAEDVNGNLLYSSNPRDRKKEITMKKKIRSRYYEP